MVTKQKAREMIQVDPAVLVRLKALAGDMPLGRYLKGITEERESKPVLTLADLIVEIRGLGNKLELSEKRMQILDIFLAKASPATLDVIRKDLKQKVAKQ